MKVQSIQPLLSLRITDLVGVEDLTVILEAPEHQNLAAQLIVRASDRTWNAVLYCGTQDPVDYLIRMSPARLRDDLEFSRPASRNDGALALRMTHDIAEIIPRAVEKYVASLQPAPAREDEP